MKENGSLSVALSGLVLSLLAASPDVFGAPYTLAEVQGYADNAPYSASDPSHSAGGSNMDNSSTTWIVTSAASADAAFGNNQASGSLTHSQLIGSPGRGDTTDTFQIAASYSLTGLPQTGLQSTTILGTSFSSSPSGTSMTSLTNTMTGNLQFVFGVPYLISSVLTIDALDRPSQSGNVEARATSTWADVFTFHGGTLGTTGIAGFTAGLSGSILSEKFYIERGPWPGPWAENDSTTRFNASLLGITIPGNTWIEVASGTQYAVHVPEPSSFILLALGLVGLTWWRRKQRAH